jgi:hypothetical protein
MINFSLFRSMAADIFRGGQGVSRTSVQGLRTKNFTDGGRRFTAIEQNSSKPSEWGKLAKNGHQVVQVLEGSRYIAVVVDGRVQPYNTR